MQTKLLEDISNRYPDIRTYVKASVPGFIEDCKNILLAQMSMATNILNKFDIHSPFAQYMEVFNGNVEGIQSLPETSDHQIADNELTDILDRSFDRIRNVVNEYYEKGAEDIKQSACPSKVIPSMKELSDSIVRNMTLFLSNIKTKFNDDGRKKRDDIKNTFQAFQTIITNCYNMPNVTISGKCISEAVKEEKKI